MRPGIWPIEDICIGFYVLKRLLTVMHILEKVMSMQHCFEAFSEKQRRVELKSVGNFVAKTVFVESANQFSLEELCRSQYSLKYFFSKPCRPSNLWQNLKCLFALQLTVLHRSTIVVYSNFVNTSLCH